MYNDQILDALESSLSSERFRTYLDACQGDRRLALRLYTWNTAVSAAFYGPLQGLEIALRNAMNRELAGVHGDKWYDNPSCVLDGFARQQISETKDKLCRRGYDNPDSGRVIAELPFGFWVSLLGRGGNCNYEMNLWRSALNKAFPNSKLNRKETHKPLDYLRTFRNRIAHHEPIFSRHLEQDYQSILTVTGWICMNTRRWIEHHSRVLDVLGMDWKNTEVPF